jgi:AcrR family transcriptional regulator
MHATPPSTLGNAESHGPCTDAPRRRGRPRSEAAAAAVLDAAYRLSASEGLRGASIQAIAAASGVSKMTIYKWWEGRLQLLIDAYLRQATVLLPLSETLPPPEAIHAHAQQYLVALRGDLGRVQLAVLAECMAETGSSELFVARYLSVRRRLGVRVIRRGQRDGSIASRRPAEALYDQIYGTVFYRFQFGLQGLDRAFVTALVEATFAA